MARKVINEFWLNCVEFIHRGLQSKLDDFIGQNLTKSLRNYECYKCAVYCQHKEKTDWSKGQSDDNKAK